MSTTFTEDDLHKRVQNANGEVIGTVTEIESEIAHVEPRSGVVDSIRSALGWGRSSQETVSIHAESVEEITVDTIHLEADSTVALDEEPTSTPADETAEGASSTDLEADSLGESSAMASSGSEIDESGPEDEIDDTDRGIATDESERGIATDEPARGIGTEKPPRDAADVPSESVPPERRPESDDATDYDRDPDERQEAFEQGGRERGDAETEAMSRTTGEPETGADTRDDAGTIEATDRIDRAADEGEAGEFGDAGDDTGMEAETDADTDADITAAANDESDTMESMNAAKGPGSMGDSADSNSEIDDSSEVEDAGHSETADTERSDVAGHDEDVEHLEPDSSIEPDPRTVANDVSEPTELDADEPTGRADETDIADEFSTGVDPDSLEDVGGTDERTGHDADATGTEDRDPTDAVDQGVDIESAAETGPDASSSVEEADTEAMDLTDEIDTGIDAASAMESERDARMSAESDAEAGAESGAGIDIETLPGQQVDAEIGPEAGARRAMPDDSVPSDHIDRRDAEADRAQDHGPDREQTRADSQDTQATGSSPITAAFAAQRAALTSGQEAVKLGLATQQNAARAALEGTLLVQRGSLEVAETATRQYVNAFGAMMGTGPRTETETGTTRSRTAQRTETSALSQTGALTLPDIEELQSQVDDDHLARELETHREHIQELRATVDEAIEHEHDQPTGRLVELLERQAELLERCQQHLERDGSN